MVYYSPLILAVDNDGYYNSTHTSQNLFMVYWSTLILTVDNDG